MQRANIRLARDTTTNHLSSSLSPSDMSSSKKAIIFLFPDVEETEFVITTNVLRRAGIDLVIVSLEKDLKPIKGCQHISILPDLVLMDLKDMYDLVVIPGGPGSENLSKESAVGNIIKNHFDNKKIVAAICGGTKVLKYFGIGKGMKVTTFPKYQEDLAHGYQVEEQQPVVVEQNLITSQGPATAFQFAFTIVEKLLGKEKSDVVYEQMGFKMDREK